MSTGQQRILIKSGSILSMNDEIGDLYSGDILIDGERIVEVAPTIDVEDALVVDATGMLVFPGMLDTHRHTWQTTLHGIGADWELSDYFQTIRNHLGTAFRPEDLYIATKLGALEALNSGISTLVDWAHLMNSPAHADAAVAALQDAGIRAVFAYGNSNEGFQLPNSIRLDGRDAERVRDQYFSSSDGLVTMALSLRGPDYSPLDVTIDDFNTARRLGLPITVHVGSNGTYCYSVGQIVENGLAGPDVTYVHCNTSTDEELRMIVDTGGHVSLAAESEMHLGCGLPPLGRLVAAGIRPGLSADVPSVLAMDMFGAMRVTLGVHRGMVSQQKIDFPEETSFPRLTTRDMLSFATRDGAAAAGLGSRVGQIAPGYQADIAIVSLNQVGIFPTYGSSSVPVLSATPADLTTLLVNGRFRKRDGVLVDVDLSAVRRDAEASLDYLLATAGLEPRPASLACLPGCGHAGCAPAPKAASGAQHGH